jgi:hypothetical protein
MPPEPGPRRHFGIRQRLTSRIVELERPTRHMRSFLVKKQSQLKEYAEQLAKAAG